MNSQKGEEDAKPATNPDSEEQRQAVDDILKAFIESKAVCAPTSALRHLAFLKINFIDEFVVRPDTAVVS